LIVARLLDAERERNLDICWSLVGADRTIDLGARTGNDPARGIKALEPASGKVQALDPRPIERRIPGAEVLTDIDHILLVTAEGRIEKGEPVVGCRVRVQRGVDNIGGDSGNRNLPGPAQTVESFIVEQLQSGSRTRSVVDADITRIGESREVVRAA